jgi:hypothetical protein
MGRAYDPARATRERLLMLERREKARAELRAVTEGVAETVALSRRRGAAFAKEPGSRETPYRRQCGLDWLAKKGRLTPRQLAAGERYGECYRRAAAARLALYRRQLLEQQDLIGACDRICGQELTPRGAGGGEREGLRLEAVLKVALDILAAAAP